MFFRSSNKLVSNFYCFVSQDTLSQRKTLLSALSYFFFFHSLSFFLSFRFFLLLCFVFFKIVNHSQSFLMHWWWSKSRVVTVTHKVSSVTQVYTDELVWVWVEGTALLEWPHRTPSWGLFGLALNTRGIWQHLHPWPWTGPANDHGKNVNQSMFSLTFHCYNCVVRKSKACYRRNLDFVRPPKN